MALPDTLERVGIVVGTALLLALPTSALFSLLFGVGDGPQFGLYLWMLPGLFVGLLVVTDRLDVTYQQVWKFSLVSYVAAFLGSGILGLEPGSGNPALAVGWWLVSVAVGFLVARTRVRDSLAGGVR